MKVAIIGGDFKETPKRSSVIYKLSNFFPMPRVYNGGLPHEIEQIDITGEDLIIWAPNIDNEVEKQYPKKDQGSVLICSKVMRQGYTHIDAISRIFKMHANAVIAIYPEEMEFRFKLIDALGNVWYDGYHLENLATIIRAFYDWTKNSVRVNTKQTDFEFEGIREELPKLIELNKIVADKFEAIGGRYFGNVSTRCKKMFPSMRLDSEYILVSRRNVDKSRITVDDFVKVKFTDGTVEYLGDKKPSVDTPIQANLYLSRSGINFMIHGHTYIEGYPFTGSYYPCGDLREFWEVSKYINSNTGGINLVNHGFLLFAETIEEMEQLVKSLKFIERQVGEEHVNFEV